MNAKPAPLTSVETSLARDLDHRDPGIQAENRAQPGRGVLMVRYRNTLPENAGRQIEVSPTHPGTMDEAALAAEAIKNNPDMTTQEIFEMVHKWAQAL